MRKIGMGTDLLSRLANVIIDSLQGLYGELPPKRDFILHSLEEEKNRFTLTLDRGERQFCKAMEACKRADTDVIDAQTIFTLYETYGFPPEMTAELASEAGMKTDSRGFEELFRQHQELSRQGAVQKFKGGLADNTVETAALHTATHLLHRALKLVLSGHASQRGSNITGERLRFDFAHDRKLTEEELMRAEEIVNDAIKQSLPVTCDETTVEKAREMGAEGLFADKYGEYVKVYSIGDFSREICGGPHAANTAQLGHFRIIKEESAASGVRRIKAVLE